MSIRYCKLDVVGSSWGQVVLNTFWYVVTTSGSGGTIVGLELIESWSEIVKAMWLDTHTNDYVLEKLEANVWTDEWLPLLSAPVEVSVGQAGNLVADQDGPGLTVTISAIMDVESQVSFLGSVAPKRGYIAFGPLSNNQVDNAGAIVNSGWGTGEMAELLSLMAQDLGEYGTGQTGAKPIRVARPNSAGKRGNVDVISWVRRNIASIRKSRFPR